MKRLLIGLFALATVLGTGCKKDEAVKPSASVNKKAVLMDKGVKPGDTVCPGGYDGPCYIQPPK